MKINLAVLLKSPFIFVFLYSLISLLIGPSTVVRALNLPDAYEMYLDTRDLLRGAPPPGVPIYCLYGVGIPTVEKWAERNFICVWVYFFIFTSSTY